MTTQPTTNTIPTQGLARVVTSLEDQVQTTHHSRIPELTEVLQLAEQMRAHADDGLTPVLERLWAASEAVDAAEAQIVNGAVQADDLLDVDPNVITTRVLESCRDRAARETLAYQNAHYFRDALARAACSALTDHADAVVVTLRRDFDRHVKVVQAAVKAGITEHTNAEELAAIGTPAELKAYRALPSTVAALDQIAGLRNELTRVLRYGPALHPVLSFVSSVSTKLDAEGLENRYNDPIETVQYNDQVWNASTLTKVYARRLGGRWLALASYPGGVELRLNTAAEVAALHAGLS